VTTDETAVGRTAARDSGNKLTIVENGLIMMDDKAAGK